MEDAATIDHRPSTVIRSSSTGLTEAEAWESARESDRSAATARLAVLDAWQAWLAENPGDEMTQTAAFCEAWRGMHPEAHVSRSTLHLWRKLYRKCGRSGLLPGYATGDRGQQIPPEAEELFRKFWLSRECRSVREARDIALGILLERSPELVSQVPSVATFHRFTQTLPRSTVVLARQGEDAYRQKIAPHEVRDYTQIAVMDCWVSDHRVCDFWCLGLDGKPVRPWVTLWIDMRSRRRVGWAVHEGPSQDTVLASLAHGVLRHGVPAAAYTDNGRDYSSLTLSGKSRRWRVSLDRPHVTTLTHHLAMAWHFAVPRDPRGKGEIERAFGVDALRFDKLFHSYCGPNAQEKPEGGIPKDLQPLQEVSRLYGQYTEEIANLLPHEGQGMDGQSPRAVFDAAAHDRRTASKAALRLLFMKASKPATVGRNGVRAFGRDYWSEAIAGAHGQRVYYRYALDDISEIDLYSLKDEYLCTLRRKELLGAGARTYREHLSERRAVRRIARAYHENQARDLRAGDLLAAKARALRHAAAGVEPGGPGGNGGERVPAPAAKVIQLVAPAFEVAARQKQSQVAAQGSRQAAVARLDTDDDLLPRRERSARPSRADLSDEAIEMLGRDRRRAMGD